MIYKRGKVYWYDFRVKKVRYRGSTSLENKRKAQEFHDDLQARKKREANGLETTITSDYEVYDTVEKYLKYSKLHLRGSTVKIKTYTWDILKRIIPDKPLQAIGTKDVEAVRDHGLANNLKNSTINLRVNELRAFTKWATLKKYMSANPLATLDKLPVPEPVDKLINDADFQRLLNAVPNTLKEIIWVDWQTGMRLANVVKLRYDQIDFEAGGIEFTPDEMKKGKSVFIDLEPELIEWFQKRRAAHPDHVHVWPSRYWAKGTGQDRPLQPNGISSQFRYYARELGIDATFHSIRHTFATRWIKNGVSLYMVGKFLSHKCSQSTQRYLHVEDLESQKEAKQRAMQNMAPQPPKRLQVVR